MCNKDHSACKLHHNQERQQNWPQSDEFLTNLESGSTSGVDQSDEDHPYNFRYQICLTDSKEISQINHERIDFWKSLAKILGSGQIIQALIGLYANNLMVYCQIELKEHQHLYLLHA